MAADTNFKAIKNANVYLRGTLAGRLEKESDESYSFQYDDKYLKSPDSLDIAHTLPKKAEPYKSRRLHPFFDNLITEGWLLQYTEKVFHIDKSNRFALLMATGRAPIGAVTVRPVLNGNEIDVVEEFLEEIKDDNLIAYPSSSPSNFPYCPTCFKELNTEKGSHQKCAKEMWGISKQPKIEMAEENPLSSFARVIYGGSISGAQKKGLFHLNKKTGILTPTPASADFILKPDGDYPELPENEHVTMAIAKALNFNVPPFSLVHVEEIGNIFAIKRFDRMEDGSALMMEDMGQIIDVPSSDKYESSCEKVAQAIGKYSSAPTIDLADFYRRIVFCFFVANADMHLKNWTLVENSKALGTFILSPCYDLLNTRLPIPGEKIDIGLTLTGKSRNLQQFYFKKFAEHIKVNEKRVSSIWEELPDWLKTTESFVKKSLLSEKSKEKYLEIVNERFKVLNAG